MVSNENTGSKDQSGSGFWLFGFAAGMLAGTALALLTTPKNGRELQTAIKDTAKTLPGRINELVDESLDLYATAVNYGQVLIEDQTQRLRRAVAAGKLAAAKKREELEIEGSSILPFQHH